MLKKLLIIVIFGIGCITTVYGDSTGGSASISNPSNMECTMHYAPVCGEDGKTYGNECIAESKGVKINYKGECESDSDESDSRPWDMSKEEALKGCTSWFDGCNTCGVENGEITMCTMMYCVKDGPTKEYCKDYELTEEMEELIDHLNGELFYAGGSRYFDESNSGIDKDKIIKDMKTYTKMLKIDDIDVEMKDKIKKEMLRIERLYYSEDIMCTKEYNPVCGEDGKTYSNKCVAESKGVKADYKGECKKEDTDDKGDKNYPKGCISWFDGCNTCSIDGEHMACTEMYCEVNAKPYCKKYDHEIKNDENGNNSGGESIIGGDIGDSNDDELTLANPASVKCEQDGGKSVILTDDNGSQVGICKFKNGKICEEWSYYRGECKNTFSPTQKDRKEKIFKTLKKYFEKKANSIEDRIITAYKLLDKVYDLEKKINSTSKYLLVKNYIELPLKDYIKNLVKNWINKNINKIVNEEAVLGGSWYITQMEWLSDKKVKVYFEEGHIATEVTLKLFVEDGTLKYEIIE